MIIIVKPWLWIVCRRWGWWWWWSQGGVGHKVRTHGEAFHHLNIQGCMFFVVRKYIIFHIFPRILHGLLLWYWTRQNYSLVEQPVDILINKLTKISIIDVNVNGYLFGPAYLRYWNQPLGGDGGGEGFLKVDSFINFDIFVNLVFLSIWFFCELWHLHP